MKKLIALALLFSSCGAPQGALDEDTSPAETGAILAFLNGADITVELLDGDVGLDLRAAKSIARHVLGADGRWGTGDEDSLDSIEELDALAYVGESALRLIGEYVRAHRVTPTIIIEGVELTHAQAELIVRVANNSTVDALLGAGLDGRAARGIEAARPIADIVALSLVPYVGRRAIEKLLAYSTNAPADPELAAFTVTSARGTEIVIEWNAPNTDDCTIGLWTTVNRRRAEVLVETGRPAQGSLAVAWLSTWGDTVDGSIQCQRDGRGVGGNQSVTRTPPAPPPASAIDCATLRGGTFDGVRFTAAQECTAVHFLDEARFSDMRLMTEIGRRTAYDCTPDGRCNRNEGRRSRWTSLAQFSGFAGVGQSTMQGLLSAIAGWTAGGPTTDTVADLWARRASLADVPVQLDRVYVVARTRDQTTSTFSFGCVEIRDAPGARNYLTACVRWVGADSSPGCTINPSSCLDPAVGGYASIRGSIATTREAPGGYRININSEGPIRAPGSAPTPTQTFATSTGTFVDLEGLRAEVLRVEPQIIARANDVPAEYPTFVAAYRVDPSMVDDRAIGAAFAHALDLHDWLTSDNVAIGGLPLSELGNTLAGQLELHSPGSDPAARTAYLELGALVARDGIEGYQAMQVDSGDASYVSVVAIAPGGEIRILGFRRDP